MKRQREANMVTRHHSAAHGEGLESIAGLRGGSRTCTHTTTTFFFFNPDGEFRPCVKCHAMITAKRPHQLEAEQQLLSSELGINKGL